MTRVRRRNMKRRKANCLLLLLLVSTPACARAPAGLFASNYRTGLNEYVQGRHAWAEEDLQQATGYFARALRYAPDNRLLQRRTFELALNSGEIETALKIGQTLVKDDENFGTLTVLRAVEAIRAAQWERAIALADQLPTEGIESLAGSVIKAWAVYGSGKPRDAFELITPGDGDGFIESYYREHLAYMKLASGDEKAAEQLLRRIVPPGVASGARAKVNLFAAIQAAEGSRKALEEAERYEGWQSDVRLSDAIQRLRSNRKVPCLVSTPQQGVAEVLLRIAADLGRQQATAIAISYARMARFAEPELDEAALVLADLLRTGGDARGAKAVLDTLPESTITNPRVWLTRADIAHDTAGTPAAVAILERALVRWPDRAELWVGLGDLHRNASDFAKALVAYDKAIALTSAPRQADWGLFYLRGMTLERLKRWPEAERDLRQALALQPDEPSVLNYLGYSFIDRGSNLQEGRSMIEAALRQRPDDGYIVDSLGWAQYSARQWDSAVATLERALVLEPGDPTINEHLGDAYWRVGRLLEARFRWAAAKGFEAEPEQSIRLDEKISFGLVDGADSSDRPG